MKTEYKLPKNNVSISLTMDVVVRCSHSSSDIDSLIIYTGKTKQSVKSAIDTALLLQMLNVNSDCSYSAIKECAEILTFHPSEKLKIYTFRKWLQMWYPFILFLRYLKHGDTAEIAARKLCSLFSLNRDSKTITNLLFTWAKNCELINSKGEILFDNSDLQAHQLLDLSDLVDDVKAKMYMLNILGDDTFIWLKHDEIEELENAILNYQQDPRNAIACAGRAYEDVLKRVSAEFIGIDAKNLAKMNGISQLANNLHSVSSIHPKQQHVSLAIGSIRNMASHGKDSSSMDKWELSSTAAISNILMTLVCIKSIFHYVKSKKYLF
jgi:hypothetical protein